MRKSILLGVVFLSGIVWGGGKLAAGVALGSGWFPAEKLQIIGNNLLAPEEVALAAGITAEGVPSKSGEEAQKQLEQHPLIKRAAVRRRLPATIVIEIWENPPTAIAETGSGMVFIDASGQSLPLAPTRTKLDLPVIRFSEEAKADTLESSIGAGARTISYIAAHHPKLHNRLSVATILSDSLLLDLRRPLGWAAILPLEADPALLAQLDLAIEYLQRQEQASAPLLIDGRFRGQALVRPRS